ncbi:MAG: S8 family peptidase [Terriglobales bacterium]
MLRPSLIPPLPRRSGSRAGVVLLALAALCLSAAAQSATGVLVRLSDGDLAGFEARHNASGEQVGNNHGLYLVRAADGRDDGTFATEVGKDAKIAAPPELNAPLKFSVAPTLDQSTVSVLNQSTVSVLNSASTDFYGSTVLKGYLTQPLVAQINLDKVRSMALGGGIVVADIDNGVDPQHPSLQGALTAGYNFLSSNADWSCYANQSTVSVLNQSTVSVLNQSTVSVLNQSTVSVLNGSLVTSTDQAFQALINQYPAIGHGTAVASLIHLVAPGAKIQPLKAFGPDGSGSLANILAAIYFAVDNGANVLNLSFDSPTKSVELQAAIQYAQRAGVVVVASAGNEGKDIVVYPAAFRGVLNTAAVDGKGVKATFSNFGDPIKVAAPGVGLIAAYPANHWAAVSGTSFAAPLVSGEAALLYQYFWNNHAVRQRIMNSTADSTATAEQVNYELGNGLVDLYDALTRSHSN